MNHPDDPRAPKPSDAGDRAERRLDDALRALKSGPSQQESAAARERAWARLEREAGGAKPDGCALIQAEIPAWLAGDFGSDRAELLADHCRECLPCRRALMTARGLAPASPEPAAVPRRAWRRAVAPLAVAATLALAAFVSFQVVRGLAPKQSLRIVRVDGQMLLSDDGGTLLAEGARVKEGQAMRTAKGSRAVLELPDGSRVEMNERAELSFRREGEGLTVDLARGEIIFEAVPRHQRDLRVRTPDCEVAVKGTVFTVGRGLKGSRVGVLEGEVHVVQGRDQRILHPGDQATSSPELGTEPLADQVSWSLSQARWAAVASEIEAAARQVDSEAIPPVVHFESHILEAMPAGTVFYAAMPNGGSLARFAELVSQRLEANPELAAWWKASASEGSRTPAMTALLQQLGRLSSSVGDEVVLALILPADEAGGSAGPAPGPAPGPLPVLVASVADEAALRESIAGLWKEAGGRFATVAQVQAGMIERADEPVIVLHAGHVLAGPPSTALLDVAAGLDAPAPVSTSFLDSLRDEYARGVEFVLAADVGGLVDRSLARHASARSEGDEFARAMNAVGLDGVDRFVVALGREEEGSATLSFRDTRSGMASWLAEPGPMGSLDFIRPEAAFATAALFRDPKVMLNDLETRLASEEFSRELAAFREKTGVDPDADLAAALGGEMALAIDGPLLPQPSWKVVLEVYDAARLDSSIERFVASAAEWEADRAARADQAPRAFSVQQEEMAAGPARRLMLAGLEAHYAHRDGYLIACPSRALLEAALQARETGSLAESVQLQRLLPRDADHVSLLAYSNLGPAVADFAQALPGNDSLPAQWGALAASGPMLVHARASDRAITLGLGSPNSGPGQHLASLLRQAVVQSLAERAVTAPVGYDAARATAGAAAGAP